MDDNSMLYGEKFSLAISFTCRISSSSTRFIHFWASNKLFKFAVTGLEFRVVFSYICKVYYNVATIKVIA